MLPTLDKEVDWLVVLNQMGQYIPANVTLQSLTLTAADDPGAAQAPPAAGATSADIGSISTSIVAKALTDVTAWGQSIVKSPIFRDVDLASGVSESGSVNFSATLNILDGAKSQRLAQFSVPG